MAHVDPLPEDERPPGEAPQGVEVRHHPELLLSQRPWAWRLVTRWRTGVMRTLRRKDLRRLSHLEVEALLTMKGAWHRAELRAIAAKVPGDGA